MSMSMEDRLKRRKLDALKRGVHRVTGGEGLPVSTHVVGIGRAGAGAIAEIIRQRQPGAPKLCALVVDIGRQDLHELEALASKLNPEDVELTLVGLDIPTRDDVLDTLSRYQDFLHLEYPSLSANQTTPPWLASDIVMPSPGEHVSRAVAKAIYGKAFYDGARPMERILRAFAASVDASNTQAVVAVIFGLGGGVGSGIAVDLTRHLSSGMFGRRVLVVGMGVAPCRGDADVHTGGHLFAVLNELDCLGDEGKNRGIVMPCGELFRNPFTAGFLMIPQQHVWEATGDLAATHSRGNREIAALLAPRGGANLWEVLRLLNWVAAPSTQHSAARTPWGPKWIHMLAYADAAGDLLPVNEKLPGALGLLPSYHAEFIEMRIAETMLDKSAELGEALEAAFHPDVPPAIVGGALPQSVQFILPCVSKIDLVVFAQTRDAYDEMSLQEKQLSHSLLLDQGVLLCEPSTRLPGMAGASLTGGERWIAVPLSDVRAELPADANNLLRFDQAS